MLEGHDYSLLSEAARIHLDAAAHSRIVNDLNLWRTTVDDAAPWKGPAVDRRLVRRTIKVVDGNVVFGLEAAGAASFDAVRIVEFD